MAGGSLSREGIQHPNVAIQSSNLGRGALGGFTSQTASQTMMSF